VFFIFGIRRKASRLATVFFVCALCHTPAAQAVTRVRTFFTLFFVPLIPLGSSYRTTCTFCGRSVKVNKDGADHLVASANAHAPTQGPPTSFAPPPPPPPPIEANWGTSLPPPTETQGPPT
jgi:hypothetical protein